MLTFIIICVIVLTIWTPFVILTWLGDKKLAVKVVSNVANRKVEVPTMLQFDEFIAQFNDLKLSNPIRAAAQFNGIEVAISGIRVTSITSFRALFSSEQLALVGLANGIHITMLEHSAYTLSIGDTIKEAILRVEISNLPFSGLHISYRLIKGTYK